MPINATPKDFYLFSELLNRKIDTPEGECLCRTMDQVVDWLEPYPLVIGMLVRKGFAGPAGWCAGLAGKADWPPRCDGCSPMRGPTPLSAGSTFICFPALARCSSACLRKNSPSTTMYFSQVIYGIVLPVVLVFILLLVNDRKLMLHHTNGPVFNTVAGLTTGVMIALTMVLLVQSL